MYATYIYIHIQVRSLVVDSRMHAKYLTRNAENLSDDIDENNAFTNIAFQRLFKILSTYREMLRDCRTDKAQLLQMQSVMVDLAVFQEALALLRIPWKRYTATHYNTLQHIATHCNTLQQPTADLVLFQKALVLLLILWKR